MADWRRCSVCTMTVVGAKKVPTAVFCAGGASDINASDFMVNLDERVSGL